MYSWQLYLRRVRCSLQSEAVQLLHILARSLYFFTVALQITMLWRDAQNPNLRLDIRQCAEFMAHQFFVKHQQRAFSVVARLCTMLCSCFQIVCTHARIPNTNKPQCFCLRQLTNYRVGSRWLQGQGIFLLVTLLEKKAAALHES